MVEESLAKNDLECACHFMAKCLTLIRVLEKSNEIKDHDREIFEQLRKRVSSNLKS
jgi:hypothetical protein